MRERAEYLIQRHSCPHLRHVHRSGQEVGGHVADEDHPVGFGSEVVLHAVHGLVGAVVHVGGRGVQSPAAGVRDLCQERDTD